MGSSAGLVGVSLRVTAWVIPRVAEGSGLGATSLLPGGGEQRPPLCTWSAALWAVPLEAFRHIAHEKGQPLSQRDGGASLGGKTGAESAWGAEWGHSLEEGSALSPGGASSGGGRAEPAPLRAARAG